MADEALKKKIQSAQTANNVAGGMQAGTAVLNLFMGFAQADLVKKQAEMQADIQNFNARLAEYDGWKQQKYGQELVARTQSKYDQTAGTMKVQAAAAGINLNEGSMSEIRDENELNEMLNISDIQNRVSESLLGFKRQASALRAGANMTELAGRVQSSSLKTAAIGNFAVGATNSMESFAKAQALGADKEKLEPQKPTSPTGYNITKFKVEDQNMLYPNLKGRKRGYQMMPGGEE